VLDPRRLSIIIIFLLTLMLSPRIHAAEAHSDIQQPAKLTKGAIVQANSMKIDTSYSRFAYDAAHTNRKFGIYERVGTPSTIQSSSGYITVCGTKLCLNDHPFTMHSATMYGQYGNPDAQLDFAVSAGLNTVELVEYEQNYRDMASVMSEETWKRNDRFIAKAKARGLRVILHFSSYGHALARAGKKPTTTDWNPFLTFVMHRKNTITGVKYAEEPAIAKIQLYGEIDAPNYTTQPMRGTTAETTAFFKRTLAQLRALDSQHVISTGGFSYINDPNSGIDWKTIVKDPNNQVCDVEVNSFGDRNVSMPNVSKYCKSIGKPWFLSAWSSCQGTGHFSDDSNHWSSDGQMAAHAEDMYKIARNDSPKAPGPAIAAVGTSFWNLGNTAARVDNCDIGHQYPLSLQVVKKYKP
jgi:hypothetical protein